MQIPPLEDYNTPFIVGWRKGNCSEEEPFYLVASTHGLLSNAPAQSQVMPGY